LYLGELITAQDYERITLVKKRLREVTIAHWTLDWESSPNGRHTYQIFPAIELRLRTQIVHRRDIVEVLSGHGECRGYLRKIGKVREGTCPECEVEDSIQHRIEECIIFERWRVMLSLEMERPFSMKNLILWGLGNRRYTDITKVVRLKVPDAEGREGGRQRRRYLQREAECVEVE
jgi:hypothetical protein